MYFFEHFEQTDAEALLNEKINLDVLQRALDARMRLSTDLAEKAFKQAQSWPTPNTLAAVGRAVTLLESIRVDAQCLKDLGRPASHAHLSAILDDLTTAWAALANANANRSKAISLVSGQSNLVALRKGFIDECLAQAPSRRPLAKLNTSP